MPDWHLKASCLWQIPGRDWPGALEFISAHRLGRINGCVQDAWPDTTIAQRRRLVPFALSNLCPPGQGARAMKWVGYTWGAATVVCTDMEVADDPYRDPSFDPGLGVRLVGSFLP